MRAATKACGVSRAVLAAASVFILLSACQTRVPDGASSSRPDFSGRWMPDPARATPWPDDLPLTPAARAQLDAFIPDRRDPAAFCMPFGTPRNTLSTEFPLEILQTPERMVMIFQPDLSNPEVRRIHLGERSGQASPMPTWFGTSKGRWEGDTLVIETVAIDTDAIVNSRGLPHSEELRVIERVRVQRDAAHGKVLIDEMELHDPKAYTRPLRATRYFVWAPAAQMRESHCAERLWINKLWRDRLHEHAQGRKEGGRRSE
jgi:hypothetical protein